MTKLLFFTLLFFVYSCSAANLCEEGWTYFCDAKQCYCYNFISTSLSWSRAHVACKEMNSHLVSLHSREERDYVYHTAGSFGISTFWTGLNDQALEGTNTWSDGSLVDFTENVNPGDIQSDCYAMRSAGCNIWQGCPLSHPYPCWIEFPSVCKKPSVSRNICPDAHGYFCTATECSCYFFSRFTGNIAARSWDDAKLHCASMGGYLASIHSEEEARSLNALVRSTDNIWIGLQDRDGDGEFTWDDRSTVTFVNWATNQTSNSAEGKSCVTVTTDPGTGQKAKWVVDNCSSSYQYICKRNKNIV